MVLSSRRSAPLDEAVAESPGVLECDGTLLLIATAGIVYYLLAARGREDQVEADAATGEAVIG